MDFIFVSGDLSLDLACTVGHRRSARIDLLPSPADLARWTVAAGLLDAPPPATAADLRLAVELREAVYRLADAARTGATPDPADRDALNRAAAHPPVTVTLGEHGVAHGGDVRAALSSVARAAAELLGGPRAAFIRECEAAPCTRLYLDTSHRRARRWCDMRTCGNRAKAAAFRARHQT
ncbi:ABATE domain-containing protein [Actinomadura sp. ATCC 31491]|uniref:ABATE domain-containing protein n=1 Tax=Actinomadura luzonensis TaxID=2805427 RepID=A0ABT0FY47_9ACTN|nr:ABATE domain-containing protein [Actinomadura luzonensis]MCK2216811.1 ABATE domain-containing protein [Actinomadura luzonensis]